MKILGAFLLISFIVHILFFLIPLPKKEIKKQEIIPVSVILEKKQEVLAKETKIVEKVEDKKPKEEPRKADKKASVAKKDNAPAKSSSKKVNKPSESSKTVEDSQPFKPKGADDPLILPDINIPVADSYVEEDKVVVPDILEEAKKENVSSEKQGVNIQEELANIAEENTSSVENSNNLADNKAINTSQNSQPLNVQSNIYTLDIAPEGMRPIVYVPKEPEFALSNNTSVTVRFDIDKQGNTYNITFITRSSADVEKLAFDYVSRIKFEAILENRQDFAQITLFFKVR